MNLTDPLSSVFRLLPVQVKALKKLGILTIEDLLYHFPTRYGDTAKVRNIGSLVKGEEVCVYGRISGLKTSKGFKTKIPMSEAWVEDETGRIKIVWFHQAYLAKMLREDSFVRVEGKVSERSVRLRPASAGQAQDKKDSLYFSNPKIEEVSKLPIGVGDSLFARDPDQSGQVHVLYPVYPETRGLTSNWIFHKIQNIFQSGILEQIEDPIPTAILKKYNLPSLRTALVWIHAPQKEKDAEAARKRFAFEEIFFIQIDKQKARREFKEQKSFVIDKSLGDLQPFIDRFPFKATEAQIKTIGQILADFKRGAPMSRLLEGDVGSGKTAVAAAVAYAMTVSKPKGQNFGTLQTAYMVPTEILAQQHFESFIKYFSPRPGGASLPINIALITGQGARKFPSKVDPSGWTNISKPQLLKWIANGEISILIGTHALIQKSVSFKHLALAIIDEQHRFGTAQRQKLVDKEGITPHLLSMTATPIPRTLALTLYGDLDLSLLDQMPAGRKQIITEIVLPDKRKEVYENIRQELKAGRQMYVICPRINEPDPDKENVILAKSVTEEAKRLKKEIFPEYEIGVLHSKMIPTEKERVMLEFKDKKIDILVATSVVEVGVNVENASLIIIEGAERFGLAQLHQLRGRVLRGTHQPYCFVFAGSSPRHGGARSTKTAERLKALKTAKNGFELAEFDLVQRGSGDLYGRKQWGITDLGMEAIKNIKMVEAARAEATEIIDTDPTLASHPLISSYLNSRSQKIHFE